MLKDVKRTIVSIFFCCGTGWNFANADVRTSVTGFWSTAWRMGWPSGAKRGSITSLGRWWRCIVGLSAWENSDSVLQKVTFCWIGFSARTRKVLDRGMPTKRFFLDDGDPRFCGCLVDLQGYQHCFWAFFWPEIRSLRGRIVARTAACPDYDKLIDRDWDWNTHCQKKTMRHLLFRWYGITQFIPTWIVIWMLYVWYSQVGKPTAAPWHNHATHPRRMYAPTSVPCGDCR